MSTLVSKQLTALKEIQSRWHDHFQRTVRENYDKQVFTSEQDREKLLTLRTWCKKYRVSLRFILDAVVPVWIKIMSSKYRAHPKSLGCTIAVLCSDRSEEILIEAIARVYPNGEHLAEWRSQEQARYLYRQNMSKIKTRTHKQIRREYIRDVKRARSEVDRAIASGKLTRRRYRNNPWLV